ncbi:Domain of unknown function DUF2147 [Methylophilaceae bacterium]
MQLHSLRHFSLCLIFALSLTSALSTPAFAGSVADDIHGLWINNKDVEKQKFAVMVEDCGKKLCGRLYWLKKPLTASGLPKRDKHNPNEALRDRPLCGLQILTGFQYVGDNTWNTGEIYNPDDGLTFSSSIKLAPEGALKIRGYVGISLFGKTLEWVRPTEEIARCK